MILMLHSPFCCKEYIVTGGEEHVFTIALERDLFHVKHNISLRLEWFNGSWVAYIECGASFAQNISSVQLYSGQKYEIYTSCGQQLDLLCFDDGLVLPINDKIVLQSYTDLTIGSAAENTICFSCQKYVSAHHAHIKQINGAWFLIDTSANGTFINDIRVKDRQQLHFGDVIYIFGLKLIYFGIILSVGCLFGQYMLDEQQTESYDTENDPNGYYGYQVQKSFFNRSPRDLPTIIHSVISIETPPKRQERKRKPLIQILGPSLTMAIPMLMGCGMMIMSSGGHSSFMFLGIVTSVTSALIGSAWTISNLGYQEKDEMEQERKRFYAYGNYLMQKAKQLSSDYYHNYQAMKRMYPSAHHYAVHGGENGELWNRNKTHTDFLYERLGLGDIPFQVEIRTQQQEFQMQRDRLQDKPQLLQQEYKTLRHVPVGIDLLKIPLLAVVGKTHRAAISLVHILLCQIAQTTCYTDVKIVLLNKNNQKEDRNDWGFLRWMPHTWSSDHSIRFFSMSEQEANDISYEMTQIFRRRAEEGNNTAIEPYYVVIVTEPELLERNALSGYLLHPQAIYGASTIIIGKKYTELPNECTVAIETDGKTCRINNMMDVSQEKLKITQDQITDAELSRMAYRLANIHVEEKENTQSIPSSVDFLTMYGVSTISELNIAKRWQLSRTEDTMRVPVGIGAGGQLCCLDIHEKFHGPHGLVAGTTGSGKSETLQSYILSLCVNYSPDDVSFFIIDFKGGGMANLFEDLPHLAGTISNLSGNQVRRAMISIQSECRRRQKMFRDHGVNNINDYTRLYKDGGCEHAIPHLLIIIDEFAELRKAEPDFMRELISVSQIGRSLGIHMILATQKPDGTVDDNIRSNSRFRLCLRVQDRRDSVEVLGRPDAAYITQAGGGILRVGNDEIFEKFQSAWSGAVYDEKHAGERKNTVKLLTNTGRTILTRKHKQTTESETETQTQLEALLHALQQTAKQQQYHSAYCLWLPVLPRAVSLQQISGWQGYSAHTWQQTAHDDSLRTIIGIVDDPENQTQQPLYLDFAQNGHHAVLGSVVSGKSTFLQTALYGLFQTYSPERLNAYIIDFSSRMLGIFAALPHVGGIVYDDQPDKMDKLFYLLREHMRQRQKMLQGGSYQEYIRHHCDRPLPAILIVVDNYAGFKEKTDAKYEAQMMQISREGASCGIYLLLSAAGFGMSEISNRMSDNLRTVFSLELTDRHKYVEALRTTGIQILPESGVSGRGLVCIEHRCLEYQTALINDQADDYMRAQTAQAEFERICEEWHGMTARHIPEIPEEPISSLLTVLPEYQQTAQDVLPIGYDRETADIYSIPLESSYCYMILGQPRAGKSNVLRMLLLAAANKKNSRIIVHAADNRILQADAQNYGAELLQTSSDIFQFMKDLTPEFVRRNKKKQEYLAHSMTDAELFQSMQEFPPIFLLIDDLNCFMEQIYKTNEVKRCDNFVEAIMERGALHNIFLFGCMNVKDIPQASMYKAYNNFAAHKHGMILGISAGSQRTIPFSGMRAADMGRVLPKGTALVSEQRESESITRTVVIPLAGR